MKLLSIGTRNTRTRNTDQLASCNSEKVRYALFVPQTPGVLKNGHSPTFHHIEFAEVSQPKNPGKSSRDRCDHASILHAWYVQCTIAKPINRHITQGRSTPILHGHALIIEANETIQFWRRLQAIKYPSENTCTLCMHSPLQYHSLFLE